METCEIGMYSDIAMRRKGIIKFKLSYHDNHMISFIYTVHITTNYKS